MLGLLAIGLLPELGRAQTPPAPPPRELVIVVVDSLERGPGRITDYDRINRIFTDVFAARKWPVTIRVERFAGNLPPHDLELRIFNKGIYSEDRGDETFHAWITLSDHGKVSDFKVVRFQYYPHAFEQEEDILEKTVRGAAETTADKVGDLILPAARRR